MAHITNIIVTGVFSDSDEIKVEKHLSTFRPKERGFADNGGKTAGAYHLECSLFIGAFGRLDRNKFINHLHGLWRCGINPDSLDTLQLMTKSAIADQWVIMKIYP